jgi:MFS family permease
VHVLWIAAIAIGITGASSDIGGFAVLTHLAPLEVRSSVVSGWNAVTGIRGLIAPFVVSVLVQSQVVNATGGLLLCAAVSTMGATYLFHVHRTPPATQSPDRVVATGETRTPSSDRE